MLSQTLSEFTATAEISVKTVQE